jgi:hypothetical protein
MVTPVNGFYQCVPVGVPVHCEISGINEVWRVVQGVDEKVDRLQREVREVIELLRQTEKAPNQEKQEAQDEDEEKQEARDEDEENQEAQDENEENQEAQDKKEEKEAQEEESHEEEIKKTHDEAPVKKETLVMEEEVSKLLQNFEKKLNEMHERMCSLEKENAKLVSRTKEMVEDQVNNEVTIELLQARVVDLENWKATNPISTASDDLVAVVKVPASLPDLEKVDSHTTSSNGSDAGGVTVLIPPTIRVRKSELETKPTQVPKPQQHVSNTPTKLNVWEKPPPDALNVRIPRSTSFKPSQDWKLVPSGVNMEADNALRCCIVLNEKNKENPKGRCLFYHGAKGCNLGKSCEFDHLDKSVICASLCKHFFDSNKTCRYGSTCAHAHAEGRPNDVPSPPRIEGCNTRWGWNGSLCLVAQKSVRPF